MKLLKIFQFISVAVILYAYNKPISKEVGRLAAVVAKKLFRRKFHILMIERFMTIISRFALYIGIVLALGFAFLQIMGI